MESQEARFDRYGVGVTVYSSPEQIMDTIDWLVRDVTIGDGPLMMKSDYGHLQALLDGTSGVAPVIYDAHETTVLGWMQYGLVNPTR